MPLVQKSDHTYIFTPHLTAEAVSSVAIPAPSLEGYRILVVDDDRDALAFIAMTLRHAGAQVTAAAGADEAFNELAATRFDALLSDIGMPGKTGYDLIHRVRAHGGANKRIPAAAFTAFDQEEDLEQVLAAGFQMHLAKPLEASYLVAAVADLIETARGMVEALKEE